MPTYRIDVLVDGRRVGSFVFKTYAGAEEVLDGIRKVARTAVTVFVKVRGQRRRRRTFDFEITDKGLLGEVLRFVDEKVSVEVYEISVKEKLVARLKASEIPSA